MRLAIRLLAGLAAALALLPAAAAEAPLAELSIEELLNIEVTSVSKKPQRLSESASAVFVITQEDIRRSGATSVPELLRMVPGANVSRINANSWAVSIRGFNNQFANKLLVLQDGRALYTPLFAGVIWEVQNPMLEDVERIEVIRGPGAAVWGANAVNGVINIITKHSGDTQGGLAVAGAGTEERAFGAYRQGIALGEDRYLRLYAKAAETDASPRLGGGAGADDGRGLRAGFRSDQAIEAGSLTVLGDVYRVGAGDTFSVTSLAPPYGAVLREDKAFAGAHLLGRWQRTLAGGDTVSLQGYLDHTRMESPQILEETRNTLDLELQHRLRLGTSQDMIWGLGYRHSRDSITGGETYQFNPTSARTDLISAFLQDEIGLVPERWRLILGARAEHDERTGFQLQPNARLLWTPETGHSLWAAVSRAVRTPSRTERDARVNFLVLPPVPPSLPATQFSMLGNRDLQAEKLLALDLGYRGQLGPRLGLELAAFRYRYEDVIRRTHGTPVVEGAHVLVPFVWQNIDKGETWGGEAALDWRLSDTARAALAYSYLDADFFIGDQPKHSASLRSPSTSRRARSWISGSSAPAPSRRA